MDAIRREEERGSARVLRCLAQDLKDADGRRFGGHGQGRGKGREIVGYHVGVKETRGEAKQGLSARIHGTSGVLLGEG